MTAVGFEPTQLALVELESTPLDHTGKLSCLCTHLFVWIACLLDWLPFVILFGMVYPTVWGSNCVWIPSSFDNTTPRGFEPLWAEPNGFPVHHLSHCHSVMLSERPTKQTRTTAAELLGPLNIGPRA